MALSSTVVVAHPLGNTADDFVHLLEDRCRQIVRRPDAAAEDENFLRARTPILCYELLGGDGQAAVIAPVTEAWNLLYDAISYLDAVIDDEIDSVDFLTAEHHSPSTPRPLGTIVNLASALVARMGQVLQGLHRLDSPPPPPVVNDICLRFFLSLEEMSVGQQASIAVDPPTLEEAFRIAAAKAGACYVAGTWSAARLLTDEAEILAAAAQLGSSLGIMAQIKDDIQGLWPNNDRPSDIVAGAWSLPITYSLSVVDANDKAKIRRLLAQSKYDADAEQAARESVIGSGALLYLGVELEKRRKRVEKCLHQLSRNHKARQTLTLLVDRLGSLPAE